MEQILASYNIEDIFIILFAITISSFSLFQSYCYFKDRTEKWLEIKKEEITPARIKGIEDSCIEQSRKLELLFESDKLRIKSDILRQYRYFSNKGSIDFKSLDCLHQEYEIYKKEGGNSFVEEIMRLIDEIPVE